MIVIGGLGSVRGAVIGAAFVTALPLVLNHYSDSLTFLAQPGRVRREPGAVRELRVRRPDRAGHPGRARRYRRPVPRPRRAGRAHPGVRRCVRTDVESNPTARPDGIRLVGARTTRRPRTHDPQPLRTVGTCRDRGGRDRGGAGGVRVQYQVQRWRQCHRVRRRRRQGRPRRHRQRRSPSARSPTSPACSRSRHAPSPRARSSTSPAQQERWRVQPAGEARREGRRLRPPEVVRALQGPGAQRARHGAVARLADQRRAQAEHREGPDVHHPGVLGLDDPRQPEQHDRRHDLRPRDDQRHLVPDGQGPDQEGRHHRAHLHRG